MEDWAEIRHLYLAEQMPINAIARRLGVSRNTVRNAVRSVQPPRYVRAPKGSIVDEVEPRVRALLKGVPGYAGDGDRGTDRLGPVVDGAQGAGAGAAAGVRAGRPGVADQLRAG